MNIALLTATLSPAAGGLSESVPHLARSLARAGSGSVYVVGVIDAHDPSAACTWGPNVNAHRGLGPRAFGYAPEMPATLARLMPSVYDVQGLWQYPSLTSLRYHRRYGTPYVVTPRGMLDPWARKRSQWKKRLVRTWFEDAHLSQAACLRATATMEAEHFRGFGLNNPIAVVPNGVTVPRTLPGRLIQERRRMLFLSRVHPKKGLELLLKAWAAIESARPDWELVIVGPDELGHTVEMQKLAQDLGLGRVEWRTAVYGEAKAALYRSADCFVLPTHAENFGLVVAEALAHEVPVITTRNAPWSDLEEYRCGWWIDLDEIVLRETLEKATCLPRERLWDMGERGRAWMERDFQWDAIAEKMLEVYRWIISGGSVPKHVEF